MDDETSISLSDLQISILRILWEKPNSTTMEVLDSLRPHRELAHTTVSTLLTRLEKRGVIASRREGRIHHYRALISENQVQKSMVTELLSSLFSGNAKALVKHLVSEDEINADDLKQIQKLLSKKGEGNV
jgi:predicted transcriptional regulator